MVRQVVLLRWGAFQYWGNLYRSSELGLFGRFALTIALRRDRSWDNVGRPLATGLKSPTFEPAIPPMMARCLQTFEVCETSKVSG